MCQDTYPPLTPPYMNQTSHRIVQLVTEYNNYHGHPKVSSKATLVVVNYCTIQCNTYHATPHNAIQYDMIRCDAMRCDAISTLPEWAFQVLVQLSPSGILLNVRHGRMFGFFHQYFHFHLFALLFSPQPFRFVF